MKQFFSLIALIFTFSIVHADNIGTLRALYPSSIQSEANAKKLINMCSKMSTSDPVVNGYKAAGEIVTAKFTKSVEQKKTILKSGIAKLEKLIASNPQNLELRMIRLSVQEHLPKIVGYNKNMTADKSMILKNYNSQSSTLKKFIQDFATQSKSFTAADKSILK